VSRWLADAVVKDMMARQAGTARILIRERVRMGDIQGLRVGGERAGTAYMGWSLTGGDRFNAIGKKSPRGIGLAQCGGVG